MDECGESGGDRRRRPDRPAGAAVTVQAPGATPTGARRRPPAADLNSARGRTRTASNYPSRRERIWCSSEGGAGAAAGGGGVESGEGFDRQQATASPQAPSPWSATGPCPSSAWTACLRSDSTCARTCPCSWTRACTGCARALTTSARRRRVRRVRAAL